MKLIQSTATIRHYNPSDGKDALFTDDDNAPIVIDLRKDKMTINASIINSSDDNDKAN